MPKFLEYDYDSDDFKYEKERKKLEESAPKPEPQKTQRSFKEKFFDTITPTFLKNTNKTKP